MKRKMKHGRRKQPQKRYFHPGLTPMGTHDPSRPSAAYKRKRPTTDADRERIERARERQRSKAAKRAAQ